MGIYDTQEGVCLLLTKEKKENWNRCGPYLAQRPGARISTR